MTRAPPATARAHWRLAVLLAALTMLGPFSIDAYLPAFGAIEADLAVPLLAVQQTLTAYLVAFAFMMLWHGALSDALGRRRVVLASLVVFALATLACAIAGNIESLWLFRGIQGLCAGAPLVVGRAIVRDRFHGSEAQRMMAQMTMVFAFAPAVAPVIGGVLLNALGWRSVFGFLLLLTLLMLAWAWRALPETLPESARQPLHPRALWRNYRNVLGRPEFLLLAGVLALGFSGFFLYIAAAPVFLVERLGVSTRGFAWLFVPMISGTMIGAFASGRLAGRLAPLHNVRAGFAFMAFAVALNLALAAWVAPGVPAHVAPVFFYCLGFSLLSPAATLLLLDQFPTMRGLASSLQSCILFSLSAFTAGTIAPVLSHALWPLALGMGAFTAAAATVWWAYERRSHIASRRIA